jgi:hypothetical protein
MNPPKPTRQVGFYQLLVAARKQWLIDALSDALKQVEQKVVKAQVAEYVPGDAQKLLAVAGLRDEHVFPVPAVLEVKPSLVGYYRLLLGASQKSFYKGSTGMGRFKSLEEGRALNEKQKKQLPAFCRAMAERLSELVRQIPNITDRDLHELPLLTFGAQLQGSNNTEIGKKAMADVFKAIKEIVKKHVTREEPQTLTITNASGRTVIATLSHDPDVAIKETVSGKQHNKVAIEVKGGTDISNAHNRAGEAEKSHSKAKHKGFRDFWTIISKTGVDLSKLKAESQTTTTWFDVAQLLARKGPDWDDFRDRLAGAIGIPLEEQP